MHKVLEYISRPPLLLKMTISFHEDLKAGLIKFDGSAFDRFLVKSGVKLGCVLDHLDPTLLEYTCCHFKLRIQRQQS